MIEDSNDFKQLQRLLALKRHEIPPPGYFHHFSREVIVRIQAGELGEVEAKWWAFDGSWLKWLWTACERRPILAGGAGVALCGFFVAASLISVSGDAPSVAASQNVPANQYVAAQTPLSAPAPASSTVDYSVISSDFPTLFRASAVQPSVLGIPQNLQWQAQPQSLMAQPVSFQP